MIVSYDCFWKQKDGNSKDEYEDAFFPKSEEDKNVHTNSILRFAIADGTTEGMYSSWWANILTRKFCRLKDRQDIYKVVGDSRKQFERWKKCYSYSRTKIGNGLQWFEEYRFEEGAFSTFLGFVLEETNEGELSWEAFAIGDSCIFQVRNEELITSFPKTKSDEFNNFPNLISTKSQLERNLLKEYSRGNVCIDDRFYLMTDALSQWFLSEFESSEFPWRILRDFGTKDETDKFPEWIDDLRKAKKLKNDDVTLLRIDVIGK
jgi:hypothetical protein